MDVLVEVSGDKGAALREKCFQVLACDGVGVNVSHLHLPLGNRTLHIGDCGGDLSDWALLGALLDLLRPLTLLSLALAFELDTLALELLASGELLLETSLSVSLTEASD